MEQNKLAFCIVNQTLRAKLRLNMENPKAANVAGTGVVPNPKVWLLDQVQEVIRINQYSIRPEGLTFNGSNGSSASIGLGLIKTPTRPAAIKPGTHRW